MCAELDHSAAEVELGVGAVRALLDFPWFDEESMDRATIPNSTLSFSWNENSELLPMPSQEAVGSPSGVWISLESSWPRRRPPRRNAHLRAVRRVVKEDKLIEEGIFVMVNVSMIGWRLAVAVNCVLLKSFFVGNRL